MKFQIQLCHTTLRGLSSGISLLGTTDFEGSLEDAKVQANQILKEVDTREPRTSWELIGKTHVKLGGDNGNGGYSVSISPQVERPAAAGEVSNLAAD